MRHAYHGVPPLREQAFSEEPQPEDGLRASWVQDLWIQQDWALLHRDRQIEENIRMLSGQQWMMFSDLLNKWIDVSEYLTDDERRWRQRPVINRLLFWYMLTHARMTENPPTVGFQPPTADRFDAMLSEAMDTIFKTLWVELDMVDKIDRMAAWLIPGGHAYLKTRVDASRGPLRTFEGVASVSGRMGEEIVVPNAPFDSEGNALVQILDNGEVDFTGEPHQMHEGVLDVQVLSPLEIRGEWGPMPHRDKRWFVHRSFLSPEEVWDIWGMDVPPDTFGENAEGSATLQRLLFGGGHFGSAANKPGVSGIDQGKKTSGLITVNELWHKPTSGVQGMDRGRLLITTPTHVLFDDGRPAEFAAAGPVQYFDFVRIVGRPSGTSPQEMLNPIQRTYNRGIAQILEHRNLTTNPIGVIDETTGLQPSQITNRPGLILKVNRRSAIPALEYIVPPALSDDVYRIQAMLQDEMSFLGNLEGAEGAPPTRDASGELVKELRFNTDRFLGPTLRRMALVIPHVIDDWLRWLPLIWDEEKVISYAGEDSVTRTVTVFPEMFEKGNVNVIVDTESMLPEGRGERQGRILAMYQLGLFGEPGTPQAIKQVYDLGRFPNLNRAHRPGGIHRVTAEQENGRLARGEPADNIAILDWYDHMEHIAVHEEFMSSPEYLDFPVSVQFEYAKHRMVHLVILQQQMAARKQEQIQEALALEAAQANIQAEARARATGGSSNGAGGSGGGGGSPSSNGARNRVKAGA